MIRVARYSNIDRIGFMQSQNVLVYCKFVKAPALAVRATKFRLLLTLVFFVTPQVLRVIVIFSTSFAFRVRNSAFEPPSFSVTPCKV